jgi:hypothetical protein
MTQLATWLWKACSELGLRIELQFELVLGEGRVLRTVARLPDLGAPKGMLIVKSYDEIKTYSQELISAGYGYSVLDDPSPDEAFDSQSFQTMFRDWGWSGELGKRPDWMR